MSFNLGVMNAATTLDNSDWHAKLGQMPGEAEGTFKKVAGYAAAYLSFRALWSTGTGAAKAFMQDQDALEDVKASLRAVGKEVDNNASKFARFASEMQKVTRSGDETTLAAMAQGMNLGVKPEEIEAVTRSAMGLSKKLNIDLTSSMQLVARAGKGQTQMFTRYGIVLDENLSAAEKYQAVLKMGAESFDLVTASAQTASGQLQQTNNAIGDTSEIIGNRLIGVAVPAANAIKELAIGFNGLSSSSQNAILILGAMSAGMLLLQTNTAKAVNAKIMLAGTALSTGGAGVQAKAEATAAEAAEAQKQTAYARTEKLREAQAARAAVRANQQMLAEAKAAQLAAQSQMINAQKSGNDSNILLAKQQLKLANDNLAIAQAKVAASSDIMKAKITAAKNAEIQNTAAKNQLAAANAKLSLTQTAAGRASLLLSGGLKAVTGGLRAFFVAMGPIGWALLAISGITAIINWANAAAEKAAKKAEEAAQKAREASEENDAYNRKQISGISRIQELAKYEQLNNNEREEAKRILNELGIAYNENGQSIDDMIFRQNEERKSLSELIVMRKEDLKQQRIAKLEKQIESNQASIAANDETKGGFWSDWGKRAITFSLWNNETGNAEIDEKNNKVYAENHRLRGEILALKNGTGELGANADEASRKQQQENEKQRRTLESLKNARDQVAYEATDTAGKDQWLTEQLAEQRKKLFDSAGNKAEADYTPEELEIVKKIIELEAKRADLKRQAADYAKNESENNSKSEEQRVRNNARRAIERQFSQLDRGGDQAGYDDLLTSELLRAQSAAHEMKKQYQEALKIAESDGVLTEEERKRVQEARRKMDESMQEADDYANRQMDREAQRNGKQQKQVGAWSAELLAAALGDTSPQMETARNTKESVRLTRQLVEQGNEPYELSYS